MATHSSTLALKIRWTEELGAGYYQWGLKESSMTERLHFHFHFIEIKVAEQRKTFILLHCDQTFVYRGNNKGFLHQEVYNNPIPPALPLV